jgi:hypothetical protein
MPVIGNTEVNIGVTPQARELIKTILDAATALKRLLPSEELEHGFEFHWGHSNSSEAGERPEFKPLIKETQGGNNDRQNKDR